MRRRRYVLGLIFLAAGVSTGCTPAWRPSMEGLEPVAPRAVIDLAAGLGGGPDGLRTYRRFDPAAPSAPWEVYGRRYRTANRCEGVLAAKTVGSLADYLGPDAPKADQRWQLWPEEAGHRGAAFFLEFDPPLIYLPASIDAGQVSSQQVRLRYYNRDGVCVRRGTVRRDIEFEGFETVEAGPVGYADCARLRIETRVRLRWGPRVNITEYVWLAPQVGEVRRTERFSGFAYLAYFSEVCTYEPLDALPQTVRTVEGRPSAGEVWRRCAVYLDRLPPHPRVGGLIVELDRGDSTHQSLVCQDDQTAGAASP